MASKPIKRANGYQVRWRHAGVWQQIVEMYEADALLAYRYLEGMKPHTVDAAAMRNRPYVIGAIAAANLTARGRTFATVWAEYAQIKAGDWSPVTAEQVHGRIRKYYSGWMDRPIGEIRAADLNERWAFIRSQCNENSSINIIAIGKAVLTFAHEMEWTTYNPRSKRLADKLHFAINPDARSPREAITQATFAAFLDHVEPADRVMVETMIELGARIAELCALRVRDVNVIGEDKSVTIAGSMSNLTRQGWTKGEHGRAKITPRPLPISDELAAMLAPLVAGRPADAPLFTYRTRGGRQRGAGFWHPDVWRARVFQPSAERADAAGVVLPEGFTPHTLRHSLATWLSAHLKPAELMERMRHRSIKQTMAYYHDNIDARRRERDAVVTALGRKVELAA